MRKILAAAAVLAFIAPHALAQELPSTTAAPNYGTMTLSGGFTPDPRVVNVTSGGSIAASVVGRHCAGFISRAPDIRLNYAPGSLPLIISVASASDTTLVINAPDGRWHCDDDGGLNGSNPAIRFNAPLNGRYEIWVGSYRSGQNARTQVYFSEVGSQ